MSDRVGNSNFVQYSLLSAEVKVDTHTLRS